MNIWDVNKKNKIGFFNTPSSITASDINNQGTFMVLGIGYDWS